ncbi:MAG: metallophosphoesterase [Chloroflexi bacterium]|nr:metallophosphoesterase [Chloroflexota bacterium]
MTHNHDHDHIANPLENISAAADHGDGVDRRGFLKCMAWAGTGVVWTVAGGILSSCALPQAGNQDQGSFTFVQVSDSHIGFNAIPNMDVTGTFQHAVNQIGRLRTRPALVLHTGDVSHLSRPDQYDTVDQILKGAKVDQAFYVPGEHDTFVDNGQAYLSRFGQGTTGNGWRSFDYKGVHFVGLINVWNLKAGGFGVLGQEQLDWLKADLAPLSASTPVVVYAHVPLWALYPTWGWATTDAEQALVELRRFGSVTVLNGHIHQVLQKVEGNITFHTAAGTAYPQPSPGTAPAPGPLRVVPDQLLSTLGIREVAFVQQSGAPVIVDSQLT